MNHYVIIDGCLQWSSPEAKRWARRAAKTVAKWDPNYPEDPQVDITDRRSDFEIISDLGEETE
jgi:hypothetical protein